jgi:hypothetical protein
VDLRELMRRRDLLTALIATLASPHAWAGEPPAAVASWLRTVSGLREALTAGEIDQQTWISAIERANGLVPLPDLIAYLDIERMQRLPPRLSRFVDVAPGALTASHAFVRVFGMRRGACLLPHVHNGMVSAHLVVSGAFHVRTHDRVRDLEDAIVLRPTRDEIVGVGGMVMMSDTWENQHWLVADLDRSFTLDIAVFGLPHAHLVPAQVENTILVDPTGRQERDGTIVAPRLTIEQAVAKFAA